MDIDKKKGCNHKKKIYVLCGLNPNYKSTKSTHTRSPTSRVFLSPVEGHVRCDFMGNCSKGRGEKDEDVEGESQKVKLQAVKNIISRIVDSRYQSFVEMIISDGLIYWRLSVAVLTFERRSLEVAVSVGYDLPVFLEALAKMGRRTLR